MKRLTLSALIGFTVAIVIFAIASTRPITPDQSTHIGTEILKSDKPISDSEQVDDGLLRDQVLAKLPTDGRVDYNEAINHLKINYDSSVKNQFFISYSYSTYKNSNWKLFFDAQAHNKIVQRAIEDTIQDLLKTDHS